ncbi:MAG: Ldh family oxidoreductase [Planctomycetaceae bacterium]
MSASLFANCDPSVVMRLPVEAAREFILGVLKKKSVFQFDAQTVADRMLEADLRGEPQHGLRRLPDDVAIMDLGDIDPRGRVLVENQTAAVATLDGSRALGPVAATKATEVAMQKAREVGIGAVAVHHSQYLGSSAVYVALAAKQGLIGLCTSNYGGAILAAPGTSTGATSDAGWAWGFPTANDSLIVIETPSTAVGRAEQELRSAWGLAEPDPTTADSSAAAAGLLSPLAGEFGLGVAITASLLAGGLAGGKPPILKTRSPASECAEHLVLAIDLDHFTDRRRFLERIGAAMQAWPGQSESNAAATAEREAESRRDGIPVHAADLARLSELARKMKLDLPTIPPG